jgi:glycosyltransferase involved in cell wall biosynthesis
MAELVSALGPPPKASHRRGDDTVFANRRVAVITNYPAPYRLPLFARIHRRIDAAGGRALVLFQADAARKRPWMSNPKDLPFGHEVLRSSAVAFGKRGSLLTWNLERSLARYQPDIVLCGGLSPMVAGRAAVWCRRARRPFGVWTGDITASASAKDRSRLAARRTILRLTDFAVAYGYAAGEYLQELADTPFVHGRNTSFLGEPDRSVTPNAPLRVLAVGDMNSKRKGHDVIIDALRAAPALDCEVTLVGDGALRSELERSARSDPRIRFTGAMPADEVRRLQGRADVFLFPTRFDVYGLALVEAMGSGAAAVTSPNAGVLSDLAVDGENCIVAPSLAPAEWTEILVQLAGNRALVRQLGENARKTVTGRWSLDHSADCVLAGLRLGLT